MNQDTEKDYIIDYTSSQRAFGLPKSTVTAVICVGVIGAWIAATMGVGTAGAAMAISPMAGVAFHHYVNKSKIGN